MAGKKAAVRVQRLALFLVLILVGLVGIANPSYGVDAHSVQQWLEENSDRCILDPEWEQICVEAMQELAELRVLPPEPEAVPVPIFPLEKTSVPSQRHHGDRDEIILKLHTGHPVEILVEFDASEVRSRIHATASSQGRKSLSAEQLAEKRTAYAAIKQRGISGLEGVTVLQDYANLTTAFVRVEHEEALLRLIARQEVKSVFLNKARQRALSDSLDLIHQPTAVSAGFGGAGVTVAVLDTGVDYTHAAFGCTAPGTPSNCRVAATYEAAIDDDLMDDPSGHGTNVSAIVAVVAPSSKLVVADVFTGFEPIDNDVSQAISWAIANQGTYNIVAMNLSIVDDSSHTSPCSDDDLATPLADALAAGIQPIVSSGNSAFSGNTFQDGLSSPACVPAAVSVGAVYDDNIGGFTWPVFGHGCTNSTTAADKVTCFSQTSSYLSLFAPGAWITAAGTTFGGTSQAAPHVTGAWAVLSAAVPNATTILDVLQANGTPVTDTRLSPGRTTPRLDFLPEPGLGALVSVGLGGLATIARRRRREPN